MAGRWRAHRLFRITNHPARGSPDEETGCYLASAAIASCVTPSGRKKPGGGLDAFNTHRGGLGHPRSRPAAAT